MAKAIQSSKSKASRAVVSARIGRKAAAGRIVGTYATQAEAKAAAKATRQTGKVELRINPVAKSRLQAAAAAARQSLSAFLLDSGLERADNVLADRTLFMLDDKTWKAFSKALEAPSRPKPRLKRLLNEPSFIE